MKYELILAVLLLPLFVNAEQVTDFCLFDDIADSCVHLNEPVYIEEASLEDKKYCMANYSVLGCANYDYRKIWVEQDSTSAEKQDTIWHEMMHIKLFDDGVACFGNIYDNCATHHTIIYKTQANFSSALLSTEPNFIEIFGGIAITYAVMRVGGLI